MTKTEWTIIRRASEPEEFIAIPAQDYRKKTLTRYVLWNERTKVGKFKEIQQPLLVLGTFNSMKATIKHVMKTL